MHQMIYRIIKYSYQILDQTACYSLLDVMSAFARRHNSSLYSFLSLMYALILTSGPSLSSMVITTSTVILPFHWHTLAFPQLFHSHSKDHLKLRLHTSEMILVSESLSWRMFFKRSWVMSLKPSWYSPTFRGTITNLDIGWRCLYQSSPWLSIYITG